MNQTGGLDSVNVPPRGGILRPTGGMPGPGPGPGAGPGPEAKEPEKRVTFAAPNDSPLMAFQPSKEYAPSSTCSTVEELMSQRDSIYK